MSLSGHKGFRKSTFLKCSNWALRGQRLSLKMFQLSWKLMGMILTIFWTSLRYLGIDSRALRGTIGRLFSFLWLYNQPFYMPPNLPRALRKGAVSSILFICCQKLTCKIESKHGLLQLSYFCQKVLVLFWILSSTLILKLSPVMPVVNAVILVNQTKRDLEGLHKICHNF